MKQAPYVLLISIVCIMLGWVSDSTILGIAGTLLLIPIGFVILGALIWRAIQ